jgi:hypothetical protein
MPRPTSFSSVSAKSDGAVSSSVEEDAAAPSVDVPMPARAVVPPPPRISHLTRWGCVLYAVMVFDMCVGGAALGMGSTVLALLAFAHAALCVGPTAIFVATQPPMFEFMVSICFGVGIVCVSLYEGLSTSAGQRTIIVATLLVASALVTSGIAVWLVSGRGGGRNETQQPR